MEIDEKTKLLMSVHLACKSDPNFVRDVISSAVAGVVANSTEANERAADMEVLASCAFSVAGQKRMSKSTREWFDGLAEKKLNRWASRGFVNWNWMRTEKDT